MNREQLETLYEAKAAAELADAFEGWAAAGVAPWRGAALSRLAFLIAQPSEEDLAAGEPLRGRAGEAADKSAVAFGVGPDAYFVAVTRGAGAGCASDRLRLVLEAADPAVVIALDDAAAEDLAAACGLERLRAGVPIRARGRVVGAAGDLAASLDDPTSKKRVWAAMKAIAAEGGLTT